MTESLVATSVAQPLTGTHGEALRHYLDLLRAVPKPYRLYRALALSALTLELTRIGAQRYAGALGTPAVRARFLRQLYGDEEGLRIDAMFAGVSG
jgi:hypothetical protein